MAYNVRASTASLIPPLSATEIAEQQQAAEIAFAEQSNFPHCDNVDPYVLSTAYSNAASVEVQSLPYAALCSSASMHACNEYCARFPETCPAIRRIEVPSNLVTFSSSVGPTLLPLDVQSAVDPVLVQSDSLSWDNGAEGVPAPAQGPCRTEVPQPSQTEIDPAQIQQRVLNASTGDLVCVLAESKHIRSRESVRSGRTDRETSEMPEQWDPEEARDREAKRADRIARHNQRKAERTARRDARGGIDADTESVASSEDFTRVLPSRNCFRGAEPQQHSFLSEFTETELPRDGNEQLSASSRISPPERVVADTQLVQTASALQSRATTSVQPSRLTDGGDRTVSVADFSQRAAFAVAQIVSYAPQIDHAAPPVLVHSRSQAFVVPAAANAFRTLGARAYYLSRILPINCQPLSWAQAPSRCQPLSWAQAPSRRKPLPRGP